MFFVLDFDFFLELKLLMEILDLGDQIEINYKYSWVEKHKRVADLKGESKFYYSWRTINQFYLLVHCFEKFVFKLIWVVCGDFFCD